jgi:AraC family transcriptional regulator
MNYTHYLRVALEFIERRLTKRIALEDVADRACFSLFHFHRLFSEVTGCTMKDYIRTRRLSEAGRALVDTSDPIPEIALRYGFESQESFTRAFKRQFRITPGRLRREKLPFPYMQPFRIVETTQEQGVRMEPKFVELGELHTVGMVCRTTSKNNTIPQLWDRYNPRCGEIRHAIFDNTCLGICYYVDMTNFDENAEFDYMAGRAVSKVEKIPQGMEEHTIPAALYAVFTHKGMLDTLGETYQKIFGPWLEGYEIAEADQIEWYDDRFDPTSPDSEFDIYIPVKSRERK